MTKICTKCKIEKELTEFHKDKTKKDGHETRCKACKKILDAERYERDKDKIEARVKTWRQEHPDQYALTQRTYRTEHSEYFKEYGQKYYINHQEEILAYRDLHKEDANKRGRDWSKNNPERRRENARIWTADQRATNPNFVLKAKMLSRSWYLFQKLKNNEKISMTANVIHELGCSLDEFRIHLESLFYNTLDDVPMTWKNSGRGKQVGRAGWEIDHISPLEKFDLSDPEQRKIAFHYTNQQPLWRFDNLEKSNKTDWIHPRDRKRANSVNLQGSSSWPR